MEEYNNITSQLIHYDEKKEILNELCKISKNLDEIKEINLLFGNQLNTQNEMLDIIHEKTEENNQLLVKSNKNLQSIETGLKNSSSKTFAFISVIAGAALFPVSMKVGLSVAISGLIYSKITTK
jgi:hypothetical protein